MCYHSNHGSGESTFVFPLYCYTNETERYPNLNAEIVAKIAENIDLTFTPEPTKKKNTFSPLDVFDYIYAVLHSPQYREKYKEFLKIDFPRVPYPQSKEQFNSLCVLGERLRKLHLFELSPSTNGAGVNYPVEGSHKIETVKYVPGKAMINETQYFGNVPEAAWQFWVGGYQPAQKYLKDRKGRTLSFQEIEHYGQMIAVLLETERLMNELEFKTFL
jgi:predicted helicase